MFGRKLDRRSGHEELRPPSSRTEVPQGLRGLARRRQVVSDPRTWSNAGGLELQGRQDARMRGGRHGGQTRWREETRSLRPSVTPLSLIRFRRDLIGYDTIWPGVPNNWGVADQSLRGGQTNALRIVPTLPEHCHKVSATNTWVASTCGSRLCEAGQLRGGSTESFARNVRGQS